jgi:hypothetical protein
MDDALWQRLRKWSPDVVGAAFPMSRRLARENGWALDFARRVVEEYRRFCYLAVVAGHRVTPSDAVDQAWHLHLCYSRDYWLDFCPNVLGTDLHHGPTRGGTAEAAKFEDWYGRTLASYRTHFGEEPPPDVWPPGAVRFATREFRRVDTSACFVLPRRRVKRWAMAAGLLLMLGVGLGGVAIDGGTFVACLIVGLIGLVAVVLVISIFQGKGGGKRNSHSGHSGCGIGDSHESSDSGGSGDSGCGGGGGCGGCGD